MQLPFPSQKSDTSFLSSLSLSIIAPHTDTSPLVNAVVRQAYGERASGLFVATINSGKFHFHWSSIRVKFNVITCIDRSYVYDGTILTCESILETNQDLQLIAPQCKFVGVIAASHNTRLEREIQLDAFIVMQIIKIETHEESLQAVGTSRSLNVETLATESSTSL